MVIYPILYDLENYKQRNVLFLPSEGNRHNPSAVLGNLQESRLGQIKVLERRIAPAAIIVGLSKVRWAKVCSSNNDASRTTPSRVIVASHFITRATAQAIVKQGCA